MGGGRERAWCTDSARRSAPAHAALHLVGGRADAPTAPSAAASRGVDRRRRARPQRMRGWKRSAAAAAHRTSGAPSGRRTKRFVDSAEGIACDGRRAERLVGARAGTGRQASAAGGRRGRWEGGASGATSGSASHLEPSPHYRRLRVGTQNCDARKSIGLSVQVERTASAHVGPGWASQRRGIVGGVQKESSAPRLASMPTGLCARWQRDLWRRR